MPHSGVILLVIGFAQFCHGLRDGAPDSACDSMTPKHQEFYPQLSDPNYVVEAKRMKNGRVRVRIYSEIGEQLQGFALQARSAHDRSRSVDGYFSIVDGISKTVDCFGGTENMLTHDSPSPKREVTTEWSSISQYDEDVIFRATVAKTFQTFWTEVDSNPVSITGTITNNARTLKNQKKKVEEETYDKLFEECFKSQGCFGMPKECVSQRNCQVLITYATTDGGIAFGLHSRIKTYSWIAAAFSTDSRMGDDYVIECIRMDHVEAFMRESWNTGKKNIEGDGNHHYRPTKAKYVDGVLTCSWISSLSFDFNGIHFDLENSTHLLLAEGQMEIATKRIGKGYHKSRIASPSVVNFTAFEMLGPPRIDGAIKVHGALMVTAWIGFVSLGILIARYFKDAWPGSILCEHKVWFALHRSCMIISLACVGVAVIVIFVHFNGWNSNSSHAVVGVITVVFGFLQPIIAHFRPDPESSKRKFFYWLHLSVGTLTHILALITMYIASKMESSGLDKSFYWVLTIFVVVYLFFHVLMQGHLWKTKKKRIHEIHMLNMSRNRDINDHNVTLKHDERSIFHPLFRVILLCIYTMVLMAIVVSLYVLIERT